MNTCLGNATSKPLKFEAEAAELFVVRQFASDAAKRMPDGVLLSQLSYMGIDTVFQSSQAGPVVFRGNPEATAVAEVLASDFRNRLNRRGVDSALGYRKADALFVSGILRRGELLEVGSVAGRSGTERELREKLLILEGPVNKVLEAAHGIRIDWSATMWRPAVNRRFTDLPSRAGERRWVCLEPTFRYRAPRGVVLYEIHALSRISPQPIPVEVAHNLAEHVRKRANGRVLSTAEARDLGHAIAQSDPGIHRALRAIQITLGVAAAVAALVLVLTPVVGDEIVCATIATGLLTQAIPTE